MSTYNYNYSYETSAAVSGVAALIICLCICIPMFALMIVAHWKLYKKANQPGWACIIPFYNTYVMFNIAKKKNLFWGYLIFYLIFAIAYGAMYYVMFDNGLMDNSRYYHYVNNDVYGAIAICALIAFAGAIGLFVFRILMLVGLSKQFGKGGGFACGLIFLYIIFICIMAFSKNIRYGQPMQMVYGQSYPYGGPNPYGQPNQYIQQNGYNQPNQYGQQNVYNQPNPYGQQNVYNQQNQSNPQNPYQNY